MKMNRRTLLRAAAASLCAGAVPRVFAQGEWPARAVKIVSPYGAGGPNDISARLIGDYLARRLGQPFVVENKTGAGTRVGNTYVANAQPDGYTILYAAAPYSTLEALYGKLGYDPRKDLRPIAMVATVPLFLVVNADTPIKTAQDLIAYGKSQTNGLTFGSPGYGSLPHLAEELLLRDAGVKGLAVQYRGDVAAYTDLLAGRVDATLTAITAALPHIKSGKLRVIGVASQSQSEIYPQATTLQSQGLPNVVAAGWYGFIAPAGVPDAIVARLDTEINGALRDPDMKKTLLAQGMEPHPGSAAEFQKFISAEMSKWGDVIKKAGIKGQ
ncbi:tripartite tricarboxylate transporter substrate binding protein [Allopusillimonas soli]|uniref:Tripartite tricarboxylate transporter substrate binding protein n=1 Tax=Allopusillimonas soli TaxID=659016 RepID=A0A853F7J6_9BURK|nr:tripartite tricarboxylate transporter substrate binding protein [Allopusillimonas soli]NYT36565.1 tripartite tricarboxylate transporter substrate binding protein [Allopusillimonas soli]TEA75059.1 tripartite tricarboxylate transporter substrate binding protein [Allopusillimonas soli]